MRGDVEQAYVEHRERLLRVCLARLGDHAEAEDAVQEAFLRAGPRLSDLHGDRGSYLTVVALNVCRDVGRRRARARPLESGEPAVVQAGDVQAQAVLRGDITRAWARLSRRERMLLVQSACGATLGEIASLTGTSVDAATKALSRARQRARVLLGHHLGGLVPPALGAPVRRLLLRLARLPRTTVGSTSRLSEMAALLVIAVVPQLRGVPVDAPHSRAAPAVRLQTTGDSGDRTGSVGSLALGRGILPGISEAFPSAAAPAPHHTPLPGDALPGWNPGSVSALATNTSPDGAAIDHLSTPPGGGSETVFAAGDLSCGDQRVCSVLFRSSDHGASWQRLAATGFVDGQVLVGDEGTLFSLVLVPGNGEQLLRSDDGGSTFVTAAALHTGFAEPPATITPGPDPIIVFAAAPLVEYDTQAHRLGVGPALPPGINQVSSVAATDSTHVVVASVTQDGRTAISTCELGGGCVPTSTIAGSGTSALVASPTYSTDRAVVAIADGTVDVSADGGRTWPVQSSLGGMSAPIISVSEAYASDRRIVVAGTTAGGAASPQRIVRQSTDGGVHFVPVATDLTSAIIFVQVVVLPNGTEIAAVRGNAEPIFGVLCSVDGGMTWRTRC